MPQPLHRPNSSGDRLAAAGIVALVLATVLLGALLPDRSPPAVRAAAEDPDCLEWSDGCRICQRLPEGPGCSLPGIACEVGPVRCLRHRNG